MACNDVDTARTPGAIIRFGSLDSIVGSKETMERAPEASVPLARNSLDVIEGLDHLCLVPQEVVISGATRRDPLLLRTRGR